MKTIDAFQFNGYPKLPAPLQQTMVDAYELCNSTFRPLFGRVADDVLKEAMEAGCKHVVELGAGNAPVTRELLQRTDSNGLHFTVCDLSPNRALFAGLAKKHEGRVTAILESVDFTLPRSWEPQSLLVLCATFHIALILIAFLSVARQDFSYTAFAALTYLTYVGALLIQLSGLEIGIRRVVANRGITSRPITFGFLLMIVMCLPLAEFIHLLAVVFASITRKVRWRGVTYHLNGPWRIRLTDYTPFHAGVSQNHSI